MHPSSKTSRSRQTSWLVRCGLLFGLLLHDSARAQVANPDAAAPGPGDEVAPCNAPVPPSAEGTPVQLPNGGYCYEGPHPQNTALAAGPSWDNSPGRHTHFYPPVDTRLFVLKGDCYRFVGDPLDFGFNGETQAYYGAHPLPEGGWCYMVGGHQHAFAPVGAQFVVVGPWLHWKGEFDSTFWSHWPYYSAFYKDLYPRYYGGGRWQKDRRAAPPLPPGYWTSKNNAANGARTQRPAESATDGAFRAPPSARSESSPPRKP